MALIHITFEIFIVSTSHHPCQFECSNEYWGRSDEVSLEVLTPLNTPQGPCGSLPYHVGSKFQDKIFGCLEFACYLLDDLRCEWEGRNRVKVWRSPRNAKSLWRKMHSKGLIPVSYEIVDKVIMWTGPFYIFEGKTILCEAQVGAWSKQQPGQKEANPSQNIGKYEI